MITKTPCFVVSRDEIFRRMEYLLMLCDEIYYSYKTNPFIGKILAQSGFALSLNHPNSLGDLEREVLERSLYYVQGESKEQIDYVHKKGIKRFVVDNENDLKKVLMLGNIEEIYLRVKFREHTFYTGKHFVFGFSHTKILEIISKYSFKDVVLGLHFHRKTQNIGEWYIMDDFFRLFDDSVLNAIKKVNIGGGLPAIYVNSKPDIKDIEKKINDFRKELNRRNMVLVMEPGRYVAAPSVRLYAKVINSYDNTLVVDASIYNAYMDTYLLHHRLPVLGEVEDGKYCYTVKGNTLDSLDIFRYRVCFDAPKREGDVLVFLNAGAYNFHCEFSFLPKIEHVVIDDF